LPAGSGELLFRQSLKIINLIRKSYQLRAKWDTVDAEGRSITTWNKPVHNSGVIGIFSESLKISKVCSCLINTKKQRFCYYFDGLPKFHDMLKNGCISNFEAYRAAIERKVQIIVGAFINWSTAIAAVLCRNVTMHDTPMRLSKQVLDTICMYKNYILSRSSLLNYGVWHIF
jgi:hypothetical protein